MSLAEARTEHIKQWAIRNKEGDPVKFALEQEQQAQEVRLKESMASYKVSHLLAIFAGRVTEKVKTPIATLTKGKLLGQLAAEVARQRTRRAKAICPNAGTRDETRSRLYYWLDDSEVNRDGVEKELQMLAVLHGIGVIVLNTQELFESQILIPAKENPEVN